jgi:hypothetical protein
MVLRRFICVGRSVGRTANLLPELRNEFLCIKVSPPKGTGYGFELIGNEGEVDNEGEDSSQSSQSDYERIKLKVNFLSCGDWVLRRVALQGLSLNDEFSPVVLKFAEG